MTDLKTFLHGELHAWPLAAENFRNLDSSMAEAVTLDPTDGWPINKMLVRHRRASITAKVDPSSIAARPCFLCRFNRPEQQSSIKDGGYEILVNPYPLSPLHFTLASCRHEPQSIGEHFKDMISLTRKLEELCVFYNGPRCGASAPDHLHFQAISRESAANILNPTLPLQLISENKASRLYRNTPGRTPFPFFIIDSESDDELESMAGDILSALPQPDGEEAAVNIAMVQMPDGGLRTFIAPRSRHRPACYGTGEGQSLISPASIEMLGTIVCSREEDFSRLDGLIARHILHEVGLSEEIFRQTISNL